MPIPTNGTVQDVIDLLESTQGINSKAELADVIGPPVTSSDEIMSQVSALDDIRSDVITQLNDKGLDLDADTKLAEVPDLIEGLSVRKYAEGTATASNTTLNFTYYAGNNGSTAAINVSGLDFRPNLIEIFRNTASTSYLTVYNQDYGTWSEVIFVTSHGTSNSTLTNYTYKNNATSAFVDSSGFQLPVTTTGATYTWRAYQ